MSEFKPNSHRSKEEAKQNPPEKRVEKVITGKVKTREKKSTKFADIFVAEDFSTVVSNVATDVLVPALKKLVADMVRDGVEMMLWGSTRRRSDRDRGYSNYISYRDYSDRDRRDRRDRDEGRVRRRFDCSEIIFETRAEAMNVLDEMEAIIARHKFVRVADVYDMVDITAPYTANDFGWTNLSKADVVKDREGYILDLPKAMPID